MSSKYKRAGGKFGGNHTTFTSLGSIIADITHNSADVTKISPGFIRGGLPSINGQRRVKITNQHSRILLTIRDNTSCQDIFVFTKNPERVITSLTKEIGDIGVRVHIGEGGQTT